MKNSFSIRMDTMLRKKGVVMNTIETMSFFVHNHQWNEKNYHMLISLFTSPGIHVIRCSSFDELKTSIEQVCHILSRFVSIGIITDEYRMVQSATRLDTTCSDDYMFDCVLITCNQKNMIKQLECAEIFRSSYSSSHGSLIYCCFEK